jgi:Family of unknown function (DUF6519)
MGSDRARISYDPTQQYRAVVAQQGRVTLEADWNEAHQIASEELREETLDFVGASGTPDDGYQVVSVPQSFDFATTLGTMYVGGIRAFSPTQIQYSSQPDWLDHVGDLDWVDPAAVAQLPAASNLELVYLLLREQEVSAIEDAALLEKALGGPDTTQRLRLIQRIVRLQTQSASCSSALDEANKIWGEKKGLQLDRATLRLLSAATLQVSFAPPPTPVDLCEPEARSGYLGANNQLIRVQIISFDSSTNQGKFVWGHDNAAFLYRVEVINNQSLRLQSRPVDEFHRPITNQAVEVLRSAAQLHNNEYVAASTGLVTTLTANYDLDTQAVNLATALPAEYQNTVQTPRLFLRVWEKIYDFTPGTPVSLGDTGLQVTLSTNSQPWHVGDYWQIAVRPGEPTKVYPQRYQEAPQPPDGPRLWACPLAVIGWENRILRVVQDCREHFDDLVKLTKRQAGGCCTVVVKPEDLKNGITLQSIVDRFARADRPNREHITICLMPGSYRLQRSLVLGSQHSNFTIEGCGDGAELQAEPGREVDFLHGLIVLHHANYVTLSNLRFQLPIVSFTNAGGKLTSFDGNQFDANFQETLRVSIGIRPLHCALLTVQNCLFRFEIQQNNNLFAAGIFAGSECWGLHLIGNRFLQDEEYLLVQKQDRENERRLLTGYLLSPSFIPTQEPNVLEVVPSLLQDAIIRDNRFAGLTTAALILADTGLIRVETNTVLQSISGFWLAPLELREILNINELNFAIVILGLLFPLPDFFDVSQFAQKLDGNILNMPGIDRLSLSLHASGNDIDTLVSSEDQVLSGPSLVVAGNIGRNPDQGMRGNSTSSVILSANKFRNHIEPVEKIRFPGTVLIVNVERSTVTGNLILNEYIQAVISLEIRPSMENSIVAVTGNIFKGRPELPPRSELDQSIPMNKWEFLNTVIQ